MNVVIFGTGYVGLVTGTCLADVGHHVTCVDIDAAKIADLKQGRIPIYEPGLEALVTANHAAGRLHFTTDAAQAIRNGTLLFIAVGTPPDEDGSADLQYVLAVARDIGRYLEQRALIVNKSTAPVGTADQVHAAIAGELQRRGAEIGFSVVSNPEFLKEGDAINDCMRPDRIIIGTDDEAALRTLRQLYAPFNRNHDRIVAMDVRSAELTKYAANAMLATKISFMNEIAHLAERVGADVEKVRLGIGSDPRIGWHFIYPGAGYGGSCFPKDVQALARSARQHGMTPRLLEAVETVNQAQKGHLFELMLRHYGSPQALRGKTIALWGLAFKPNTDDMREAPSRRLLEQLWAAGARVRAHDPKAMAQARRLYGERSELCLCESAEAALDGANALAIVTEWKSFRSPNLALLKTKLQDAVIFDGRNLYEPEVIEAADLAYYGIGRGRSIRQEGRNA